jgi:hypothetical protein
MTYTYALLEISPAAYEEIKTKLEVAGYADQFHEQDDGKVAIDMHGIALVPYTTLVQLPDDVDISTEEGVTKLARSAFAELDVKLAHARHWIEFHAERHNPESLTQQAPELLKALDQARTVLSFVKVTPVT